MKSVMQEASSIAKAIEQAWAKAGEPQEFTIKILEEPQKNFIGFTTRSAKVALFFENLPQATKPSQTKPRPVAKKQSPAPVEPTKLPATQERQVKPQMTQGQGNKRREYKPQWNDSMIECTQKWLSDILSNMGLSNINFKIEPSEFYLRISFDHDLLSDQGKEKKLFASFATLIIETLKKTFKTSLRGHKIVLIHASPTSHDTQSR